jgi:hypothetical protein
MKDQNFTKDENICFVANFYKTWFFERIAKELIANNISICWIVTKPSQAEILEKYYENNKILKIDRTYIQYKNTPVDDFKINELIFGDRVWKNEIKNGQKFLINIQRPIYTFIKSNNINLILGEVTWAHELLIHRMVTNRPELNCKYYSMHTVRIPDGRFAFFEDEKQAKLYESKKYLPQVKKLKILEVEKPTYLEINNAILKKKMSFKGRISRIKRLITGENIEKSDPNLNTKKYFRWKIPIQQEFNRECYKFVKRKDLKTTLKSPYIFFGFHKQPEASIDVCGRYFENQMDNVINLWRQLPTGWNLVVKEHTNAIGDRGYRFFNQLNKYPGIILANEKIDSHQLIKNSKLVATNTGTIALEAALMGCPSITFSPVFFNKHNYCKHVNWTALEGHRNLEELINEITALKPSSEEYTEYIVKNSFEGIIGDAHSNPAAILPDNISKITTAIISLLA